MRVRLIPSSARGVAHHRGLRTPAPACDRSELGGWSVVCSLQVVSVSCILFTPPGFRIVEWRYIRRPVGLKRTWRRWLPGKNSRVRGNYVCQGAIPHPFWVMQVFVSLLLNCPVQARPA
ncbi:hypothetical protein CGRA01v4_07439 [Colletotrichum graminicola]|nr:hypothetical protein CGRA01v4_07439 [Colletotrichum graminicola]